MVSDKRKYRMFSFVFLCLFSIVCANESGTDNRKGCHTPDNKPGICIPITDCSFITDILRKEHISTETKAKLRSYQCGFENKSPKVCCPHKNSNLINEKYCGFPTFDKKILGGNNTEPGEFPWSALISYNTDSGQQLLCGGSIINENYVLTSAHCIQDLPLQHALMTVRLGEHDISKQIDCVSFDSEEDCAPPAQDIKVSEIIPHSNYNPLTLENNIGLLRLSKPVNFSDFVKPICLPDNKEFNETRLFVAGWGANHFAPQSTQLLHATYRVASTEECQRNYSKTAPEIKVGNNQICVQEIEKGRQCIGERGEPLFTVNRVDNQQIENYAYVQFGIMSFSSKLCENPSQPKVLTKVAPYINWILDNIKP